MAQARRRAAFFEIAPASVGDAPAAAGFALSLVARLLGEEGGAFLWIAEDFALMEGGAPHGPGLAAFGLDPRAFVLMRLSRRADVFLAAEEAIRARAFGAIVFEPAALGGADAQALVRRLAAGARSAQARAILLRPPAGARQPFLAPTSMRFEVASRPAPRPAAGRRPLPGQGAWRVRCAGPPGAFGFDGETFLDIDHPAEDFLGRALSLRMAAGLGAGERGRAA
jgi:protein ImuA